ncbi:hypothetical protein E4U58_000427 [Claviceps cyperi]|nr:hypothetical protein E4U58_000427 [Claviceps cyperi]
MDQLFYKVGSRPNRKPEPRASQFNYLGSIIEKPSHGYAVKQSDEHPPAYHVQTADLNAILRALDI